MYTYPTTRIWIGQRKFVDWLKSFLLQSHSVIQISLDINLVHSSSSSPLHVSRWLV